MTTPTLAVTPAARVSRWPKMFISLEIPAYRWYLVGMIFSNFNALAMEPQGHIAGTASSLFGSITTLIAASIGSVMGHAYDHTLTPLSTGFLLLGALTLLIIAVTEKGRLFRAAG